MKKQLKGSACLVLATVIWGSAFVSQSIGMAHIGPFTFQAVRCLFAAVALLICAGITDRFKKDGKTFFSRWKDKRLWKAGVLAGIPLFLACNLQQVALVDVDAGKSGFLTAMYIIFVPILSLLRGQKLTWQIPVSVVTAVAGLYCLSCVGVTGIALGDLLLLGCAVMFAVQIMVVDKYAGDTDPLRLNFIQVAVCTLLSATAMAVTEQPTWEGIGAAMIPLLHAGVLSMGAAYTLQIIGQQSIAPSTASLIMSLESVFAVLFGWLILSEMLTIWEAIGCVLVFAAVIISQLPAKKHN